MELTILLAKVFGLYMTLAGLAILFTRRHMMLGIFAMTKERFAQLIAGFVALLVGALLINIHTDWSTTPAAIISVITWLIFIKGVLYLFLPEASLNKFVHMATERSWYLIDGILVLVVGAYLVSYGYNLF